MVRTVCCTANMPRRQLYGKSVSSVCKASPALAKEGGSHFWGYPPCVEKQERFLILSTHEYERNLPHAGLAQMIVQSRLGEYAKMSNLFARHPHLHGTHLHLLHLGLCDGHHPLVVLLLGVLEPYRGLVCVVERVPKKNTMQMRQNIGQIVGSSSKYN